MGTFGLVGYPGGKPEPKSWSNYSKSRKSISVKEVAGCRPGAKEAEEVLFKAPTLVLFEVLRQTICHTGLCRQIKRRVADNVLFRPVRIREG